MSVEKIRELNDAFRRTFQGGMVTMTDGVSSLPESVRRLTFHEVQRFDAFTADNDPHGEHDFGSFEIGALTFFWKIEYYDKDLQYGSEDLTDPLKTTRVLTVMLAEEY